MTAHRAGLTHFGESYVQEALPKMDALASLPITWHFVGRLQANKTRQVAERFDWVHTVDRLRIAERLNEQRPAFAAPLNVLIQVNQGGETHKSGAACGGRGRARARDPATAAARAARSHDPAAADRDTGALVRGARRVARSARRRRDPARHLVDGNVGRLRRSDRSGCHAACASARRSSAAAPSLTGRRLVLSSPHRSSGCRCKTR